MTKRTKIIIGVVALAAVGIYLYRRNKSGDNSAKNSLQPPSKPVLRRPMRGAVKDAASKLKSL
jgi:hypothetical protein